MDIKNVKLLYLKGALFVVTGLLAAAGILLYAPSWRIAILLVIAIWSFARAYYFAFHVIEHYVDPGFRFAGLSSFVRYILRRELKSTANPTEPMQASRVPQQPDQGI